MKEYVNIYADIMKQRLIETIQWPDCAKIPINSIASYLAMFPENIPKYFIEKYTQKGDWVMDNFSGRGTTAITARELDRNFVGNDLNPYAYVLTKSKIAYINSKEAVIERIKALESQYYECKSRNVYYDCKDLNELQYFYHNDTLNQLLFLRNKLGINWLQNDDIDNMILALALGLMHGKMKKDGLTSFFSLDMPNTISFSPEYVNKYAKKYNLHKPNVNIFSNLIKRWENKYHSVLNKTFKSNFQLANSTLNIDFIPDSSISLVITSPPYLSIVDYTKSNWLKLWLLGYDRQTLKKEIVLSDDLNIQKYEEFLLSYLDNIYNKLKLNGKVCLVIGDVYKTELIEKIWNNIKNLVRYKFVNLYVDNNIKNNKITKMLNTKRGNATKVDKILVIERD